METFWWIIGGVSGFLVLAFIGGRYERRGERRRAADAADDSASEFIQQGFFRIRTAQNDRYKKERQERETEEHKRPVLAVVLVALAFLVGGWFVLDTAMSSEDWGWLLWFIPSFLAIPILLWWHKHFTDAETRADRDAPKKIVVLSTLLILEIHGGDSMVRLARDVGLGWDAHLSNGSLTSKSAYLM